MTTEQPKSATIAASEPSAASASTSTFPQLPPFSGSFPPLPPGYPPFFAYPPPTDGQQGEGGGPAPLPFPLMYPPPGMVYAFPPQPTPAVAPPALASPSRTKRRQVKMACTNCAAACKRCDETRPCERCKKYGMADSCADGQRKERKKGVKRGPYKRKNKSDDNFDYPSQSASEGGEWPQGSSSPPPNAATPPAAIPVAQFPSPEGFYPVYLPPGYPLPEPHPNADGSTPSAPTLVPVYIGGFYPGYPPGTAIFQLPPLGTHPPPPPASQSQTAEAGTVSATDKSSEEVASTTQNDSQAGSSSTITNNDGEVREINNTKAVSIGGDVAIKPDSAAIND